VSFRVLEIRRKLAQLEIVVLFIGHRKRVYEDFSKLF